MNIKEVEEYYVNGYRFSQATGMAQDTFRGWVIKGYIPINSQVKLEKLSGGRFKASLGDMHANGK